MNDQIAGSTPMTLNDLTISPEGLDLNSLLSEWEWTFPEHMHPVLITAMGDVFAQGKSGAVYFLETSVGSTQKVAKNGDEFKELLKDTAFVTDHMYPGRVAELREMGLVLAPGQCYSYKLPLFLGGQDVVENVEICPIAIHVAFAGGLYRQVKDLPPGTKINKIVVKPPEEKKPWWKR